MSLIAPRFSAAFAGALVTLLGACTYDFDQFTSASEPVGSGGSGGSVAGSAGSSASEGGSRAGSPSGGQAGSSGGVPGGSAGAATEPAGAGGADGGSAGQASAGSSPSGGAASGGSPSGGFDCAARTGTMYGGHCYFKVGEEAGLTWSAAKSACAGFSAHLVSITSEAEQAALVSAFSPATADYWIGLALADVTRAPPRTCERQPASCPFSWESGESFGYENWGQHSAMDVEPNYSGACVRIQSDGTWADQECSRALAAICEHEG